MGIENAIVQKSVQRVWIQKTGSLLGIDGRDIRTGCGHWVIVPSLSSKETDGNNIASNLKIKVTIFEFHLTARVAGIGGMSSE